MVTEAEFICHPNIGIQYLYDVSPAAAASPISLELSRCESALSCSTSIQTKTKEFSLRIRSGSHTDIGPRNSNEDELVRIDDLCTHLGSIYKWPEPSSFYAIFDGHGGADAAAYMKNNATKIFFEDAELPQTSDIDEKFLQDLESCHRRSFLLADRALADEHSFVDSYCGTTALTGLVLGRNLLIANAGDSRAVLCRKGDAIQLSQDHRPSCQAERKRVEDLGGTFEDGYLNGDLAVTRALGDWYMKLPFGSASPLTAEPEFQRTFLTEDDEFLILGCDGIWDYISNQEAVRLVRRGLRRHNDPEQSARELIRLALRQDTCDNVTAIVVCFSFPGNPDPVPPQRPRLGFCMSEEARNKLRSLFEGN